VRRWQPVGGGGYVDKLFAAEGTALGEFGSPVAFDGSTVLASSMVYPSPVRYGAAWFFGGLARYRTGRGVPLTVGAPGVKGNDDALRNDTLNVASGPAHGTVVLNQDGSFTYTPHPLYVGTDSFTYTEKRLLSSWGSGTATVYIEVLPNAAKSATSISIRTSATSVRYPKTFNLTGIISPGLYRDPCTVWVKKPGSRRWSYSSARLAYSTNPDFSANWWYRYTPKVRGKYAFKASYPGDALRTGAVSPNIVYVTVK
jgi:hypothetical protein